MIKLDRQVLRTSRMLDFCSEKELVAQTGHRTDDWPLVVLKELVDNALDACEESGVTPMIDVKVDGAGIIITDNGPGIPEGVIEDVLDFSVRVSSREAYAAPDRGAQGNALKTIVAMPFVLDGKQGSITVETGGRKHSIDFSVDAIRQKPVTDHSLSVGFVNSGTRVTVNWPDSACSILDGAKARFLQFAGDYAWLNPHLTISVDWFGEWWSHDATSTKWPKWKPSDPTSAHWYQPKQLERLIAAYVAHDADHGHDRTVRELVSEFRGLSSSKKQKAVLDTTGLARANLSGLCDGRQLNSALIEKLAAAMKEHSKPVKPQALGIIGKEHFRHRFEAAGCEMESFDYRKVIEVSGGIPWVVETAFGWCPDTDQRRLVTGINWSPGIINPFRQLGPYGASLDTVLTEQRATIGEPVILVLHMACPRVEYTDRGKSAVVIGR